MRIRRRSFCPTWSLVCGWRLSAYGEPRVDIGWADKLQGLTTKMMGQHLSGTEDVPDQWKQLRACNLLLHACRIQLCNCHTGSWRMLTAFLAQAFKAALTFNLLRHSFMNICLNLLFYTILRMLWFIFVVYLKQLQFDIFFMLFITIAGSSILSWSSTWQLI